ncbi:hypothetical protein [Cellvibrio zantedeschiae]|uniref:hypothetical protein n=1 Tax=Cellvibrio zantedeschiae TaxID=1237077 RepID=UPI00167C300E|nr:hypothetical protein [Cellvibrio zantedeschiae]
MHKLNCLQKSIAIAAPAILLSAPAFAHGGGLVLLFVGFPLLAALFLFYLGWSVYTASVKKRFATFMQSIVVGALWLVVFIGPWLQGEIENFLREYEIIWAFAIPLLLFVGSWILLKKKSKY